MSRIVLGYGRLPNKVMLVGESPGREEAYKGRPFVGKSGIEQEWYLSRRNLTARQWYLTNVCKEFNEGNPDPTPEQIEEWTPVLYQEIDECQPELIIAVGKHAAQWFLGNDITMEMCHGLPHRAGQLDPSRRERGGINNAVILPVYHPAFGFYNNDMKSFIDWDYEQVSRILNLIKRGKVKDVDFRVDAYVGREDYRDISGVEMARYLDSLPDKCILGLDTEGDNVNPALSNPWSFQISNSPGKGLMLRVEREDFNIGSQALQRKVDRGALIIIHNEMYDREVCRKMGIELFHADTFDTMYAAYLLRLEPQGLKPMSWRMSGMRMQSFEETVGDVGLNKQIDFLSQVVSIDWPFPSQQAILENDGRMRMYQPRPLSESAYKILVDIAESKTDKDGNPVDPIKRWDKVIEKYDREFVRSINDMVGPMPIGLLSDLPLKDATYYACRDADATLRDYYPLRERLRQLDLIPLMISGEDTLPIFEEIQANGLPASRSYFEKLHERLTVEIHEIGSRISHKYYGGKPFNPKSPDQVRSLLRRQGLEGNKRTKTGKVSTGKNSIEYLRYENEAISDIFDWRERQHVKDSFCNVALDRIPPKGKDIQDIRFSVMPTRVATRRIATKDFNPLSVPVRTDLGKLVRDGYMTEDEEKEILGSWDLSQIELRVMADESVDPLLTQAFLEDRDPHSETASRMFKVEINSVDKMKHRYPAKTTGFGILYGLGPDGLLTQFQKLGLRDYSKDDCADLIRTYLQVHEGIDEYIKRIKRETIKTGMVRDRGGMIRYLPGIWSTDRAVREEAGRVAVSHRIQGTAQFMLQESMRWLKTQVRALQEAGYLVKWRLQFHDELMFSFQPELSEVMYDMCIEALTKHCGIELSVPVKAEGKTGRTWGELK